MLSTEKSQRPNWRKQPTSRQDPIRERYSQGIACTRFNGNKPEILLIKKRCTYAFIVFVHGKYDSNNNAEIMALLNKMTVEEKLDLLSVNYVQLWYRVWLNNTARDVGYFTAKNKFESTFAADGGARLKRLIDGSTHGVCVWEIPKGRKKNKTEQDIHCAIREFYEETHISKGSYYVWLDAKRTQTYVDDGVKYINQYFIAHTKHNIEPKIKFKSREQVEEVADIKWMDIEKIRQVDESGRLAKLVKPIFNYVKKHT